MRPKNEHIPYICEVAAAIGGSLNLNAERDNYWEGPRISYNPVLTHQGVPFCFYLPWQGQKERKIKLAPRLPHGWQEPIKPGEKWQRWAAPSAAVSIGRNPSAAAEDLRRRVIAEGLQWYKAAARAHHFRTRQLESARAETESLLNEAGLSLTGWTGWRSNTETTIGPLRLVCYGDGAPPHFKHRFDNQFEIKAVIHSEFALRHILRIIGEDHRMAHLTTKKSA